MIKDNPSEYLPKINRIKRLFSLGRKATFIYFYTKRMYLVCLICARLTCFERDRRLRREQVTLDPRTKDWENERRPGKNTIQNIAKTTRKQKENMIYKTWSNWWETVPSHLAVFENPLSTSCILSAKSWVCDGLRWKPSAISGRFISIWPDKQMHFIFSQWRFSDWRTNNVTKTWTV